MQAQVRQNFHPDSEAAINKLISIKYYTSYVYLAMSFYFERDDVALESFAKYFHELSELLRKNAEELINYQKLRGGRVQLENIEKPERREWTNGLDAIQFALELQKTINKCLLELHHLASNKHDPQMCNFLESNFLNSSVEIMKKLGEHITSLKKLTVGQTSGMGEYLFNKHTLG
ncbi:ferritin, lower subunit-like isoform X1 [Rhincodon typus]|uniref:ferritin, lower subunit-like isoform X1 n=1 Tax=Rhincodon typus TaxID=259920 RepID=UPI00202E03F4|nr:ferritin, lower subunit-like isoform X1 [Rhincodon typus]